jgi:hypothetical protein
MATSNTLNIGRLQRVPLRDVWKHEAYDFTQWLQENIDVLNIALDLNLVNVEREQAAGSFSVDLVAQDESGGTVIIENQLEKSNHDHLGKVITYLTAFSAKAAIWIVSEPRPEHVAAIAWLNEATSGADFYLVKLDAVKIGDSPAAPLLTLIVGPSEDSSVSISREAIAEVSHTQKHFWKVLIGNPKAKLHSHITPGASSWIATTSGIRGLNYTYTVAKNQSTAELYIDRGKNYQEENKNIFDQLFEHRGEIDSIVGREVGWERLDGKRACRIKITLEGGYRSTEENWESIHSNMADAMNALDKALTPHLKRVQLSS